MRKMRTRGLSNRRIFYVAGAAMLLAMTVPLFASAAQLLERSVALSSASTDATGVTYEVNFTAVNAAGAFVVDFCSNTPVIGQPCTAPAGMDVSAASSATPGFTDVDASATHVVVAGSIAADDVVSVALNGITNPSEAGSLYARILTYASDTDADGYTSEDIDSVGAPIDDGSVAISITDTIGVSVDVLESLTFCVSKNVVGINCADTEPPLVELGELIDGDRVLTPTDVSEGVINAQISTNALGGAVVRLKSGTDCGGMKRPGVDPCDIAPALDDGIVAGQARFGVKAAASADTPGADVLGTFQPASGSIYNSSTFALNYAENDITGVTSAFGDPFLDTAGAPASNKNVQLTFGASITDNTPAGVYSTSLNLIATGKF